MPVTDYLAQSKVIFLGFFNKILSGLSKTRENFCNKLDDLFASFRKIDDELFDELEEILITSDIGIETSENIVNAVKKLLRNKNVMMRHSLNKFLSTKSKIF